MIKNLKKVISTLAAVAILATSASAFAVSFPDVDANASYAGAVDALTTLGVVNGDDNGKFNPENTVTRAEFAKMVVEALGAGSEAASSTDTKFVDAKGHWAAGYIEVGVAKAFINGYDEKTFGPDDQVTYAQAVKMLVAAIGYETYASQQGGWPSGYLAYGSELDIIAGVTGVSNDTALTRAQCAVLIYNTLKAPICKVDGYEQNYKGEWVPKLEEMNGTAKGWQTLLTSKHDAFVVRGRVMSVDKKEGTVSYKVEAAENFDGYYVTTAAVVGATAPYEVPAYIGTTAAADMLYTYSEAIIQ
ncbi:MAG: S-layer homology domain-containing protein, partial [Clostridia bacterium]|nr:S-layer homology domain-containing protein [Clostridia bacterium]